MISLDAIFIYQNKLYLISNSWCEIIHTTSKENLNTASPLQYPSKQSSNTHWSKYDPYTLLHNTEQFRLHLGGEYRLSKVGISTIIEHILMLKGKSSMGKTISNFSDDILPLNLWFENSYFCIICQHFQVFQMTSDLAWVWSIEF